MFSAAKTKRPVYRLLSKHHVPSSTTTSLGQWERQICRDDDTAAALLHCYPKKKWDIFSSPSRFLPLQNSAASCFVSISNDGCSRIARRRRRRLRRD